MVSAAASAAGAVVEVPEQQKSASRSHRSSRRKKSDEVQMKKNGSIKIIPLGGLDQIGMNITAFESDDSIIIVDWGSTWSSRTSPI